MRWLNIWIQWMTQEPSSSQLNNSRTNICPSSTPSLCGRPMDVWSYWTSTCISVLTIRCSISQAWLELCWTDLPKLWLKRKIESRKSTISAWLWHGVVTMTGASIRWKARCWHWRQRRPPGNESDSSQMNPSPQWLSICTGLIRSCEPSLQSPRHSYIDSIVF